MSTLRSWALALGGEVSGNSVSAPGPGHSACDRSLSITPTAASPNGFLVNSFAGDDPLVCLDYVRAKLGLPAFSPKRPRKPAAGGHGGPAGCMDRAEPEKATGSDERGRKAAWLWSIREPVSERVAAGLYLRKRGYEGIFPATLRYLPPRGKHAPTMIGAFGFCEEPEPRLLAPPNFITGVHITRLTLEGGKAPIDPVKITLGPSPGFPIVLASANDLLTIDITETLSQQL